MPNGIGRMAHSRALAAILAPRSLGALAITDTALGASHCRLHLSRARRLVRAQQRARQQEEASRKKGSIFAP